MHGDHYAADVDELDIWVRGADKAGCFICSVSARRIQRLTAGINKSIN